MFTILMTHSRLYLEGLFCGEKYGVYWTGMCVHFACSVLDCMCVGVCLCMCMSVHVGVYLHIILAIQVGWHYME